MNDVPQPPLLENTATMRPFFLGASTCCLVAISETRVSTVRSSSALMGMRRNSARQRRLLQNDR